MSATLVGSDALVTEQFVLEKIDYFSDIQLWPRNVQPKRWLDNFSDCERPYAVHLLNSFVHFNQEIVDQLFVSAFHLLSCEVVQVGAPLDEAVQAWDRFSQSGSDHSGKRREPVPGRQWIPLRKQGQRPPQHPLMPARNP